MKLKKGIIDYKNFFEKYNIVLNAVQKWVDYLPNQMDYIVQDIVFNSVLLSNTSENPLT